MELLRKEQPNKLNVLFILISTSQRVVEEHGRFKSFFVVCCLKWAQMISEFQLTLLRHMKVIWKVMNRNIFPKIISNAQSAVLYERPNAKQVK